MMPFGVMARKYNRKPAHLNRRGMKGTSMRVLMVVLLSMASLWAQSSRPASDDTKKTVHVRRYTRKDGTVVHSYNRAAPGTAAKAKNDAAARPVPSRRAVPVTVARRHAHAVRAAEPRAQTAANGRRLRGETGQFRARAACDFLARPRFRCHFRRFDPADVNQAKSAQNANSDALTAINRLFFNG
jgi:hypothetical protein